MKYIISFGVTVILFLTVHEGSASVCEKENIFGMTTHFNCPQPGDPQNAQFCCGTDRNRYCCDTPFGIDEETLKQFADKSSDSDQTDNILPSAQALKVRKFVKKNPVALAQVQESPIVPKTASDQEGVRDTVDRIKGKVNSTARAVGGKLNPKVGIQKAKDKVKDKVKLKVKEKAKQKLPVILGVIGAVILGLIVLCIVCCCCCPFCLLHKRRNRGAVHNPNTADVTVTQPLQPMQPYPGQQPIPGQQPYPAPGGYPPQQQPYAPQPYPPQGYPAQPGYPPQPYPPQGPPVVYPVDQPPPYSEKQLPYNPNYQQ